MENHVNPIKDWNEAVKNGAQNRKKVQQKTYLEIEELREQEKQKSPVKPLNLASQKQLQTEVQFQAKEILVKAFQDPNCQKEFLMDTGKRQKRMPKGLEEFVHSELGSEFLDSVYDYCVYLIKMEDKKKQLEIDARERRTPMPLLLNSETDRLSQKAKRMADNYGRLIFMNRSIGQQHSPLDDLTASANDRLQFKTKIYLNKENDNAFFNGVVRIFAYALKKPIKELEKLQNGSEYFERVEIEIDRLFKTNVFNVAARNEEQRKLFRQYPELAGFKPEELKNDKKIIERLQRRGQTKSQLPNFKPTPQYAPKGEIRPLFVNLTPFTCRSGRSPLISMMFPTIKDKITDLSKTRAVQNTYLSQKPSFIDNSELELLVKHELKKRNLYDQSISMM